MWKQTITTCGMKNIFKLCVVCYRPVIKHWISYILKFLFSITLGRIEIKKLSNIERSTSINRVSFHKTLFFNLRSLPFEQALKFPIHIYTNTKIISSSGIISLCTPAISFGMIKWGIFYTYRSQGKTLINNNGTIIIKGNGSFLMGSDVSVFPNAILEIGTQFFVGENAKLYVQNHVVIGKNTRISYLCDISDSDYHYMVNLETGTVRPKNKKVIIGDYNWIGNNTSIKKGTITPHHTVVASAFCVLSKDYRNIFEPYSIIGGNPVKLLKEKSSRVWYDEMNSIKKIDELLKGQEYAIFTQKEVYRLTEDEGI